MTVADRWELGELSSAYAFSVDQADGAAFAAVFTPRGRLTVFRPGDGGTPSSVWSGHEELAKVPAGLAGRYLATRHVVGQSSHTIDGDAATGQVYCTAHHLDRGPDGAWDVIRFVRYTDTYERTPSGWLIAERVTRVEWAQRASVQLGIEDEDHHRGAQP